MSVRAALEDVSVSLGGKRILEHVSLDVQPGELVTLLGPSGSGKTTSLNVLAGFLTPERGHVRFDERIVDDIPPREREIGIVFQSYALFPHLSVSENIAFPLRARRCGARERSAAVEQALELVRLGGMADRAIGSLSGGQQQRVALARALVFQPRVLLLDEPLTALDKGLREAMQVELKRIQRDVGVTTIAVTHDQTEALTMSDRVAIMRDGRIEQVADPVTLYRHPRSLFVAGFLGEANLFDVDSAGNLPAFGFRCAAPAPGTAILRPEDLGFAEHGVDGVGGAPVRVEAVDFQGVRYRVVCSLASGEQTIVTVGSDVAPHPLQHDQELTLVCRNATPHVIPAEAAGAAVAPAAEGAAPAPSGDG